MVSVMKVEKAPLESYADIGGLGDQIQEIKEAAELPLAHPELYGKTLLTKVVANQTSATFLRVFGSDLIQKYLGHCLKLVRELFRIPMICRPPLSLLMILMRSDIKDTIPLPEEPEKFNVPWWNS